MRELTLLVTPSPHCVGVIESLPEELMPSSSAIAGIFDLTAVEGDPEPQVLRASSCEPIDLSGDPARLEAVASLAEDAVLSFDPLRASGSYVLVGAVYWGMSGCRDPRGEPRLCFISEPFGEANSSSDDVHLWGVCAQEADTFCFDAGTCGDLVCSGSILSCSRDSDCGSGCGPGLCVEDRCVDAEGGPCPGTLCSSAAQCNEEGCTDGAVDCAPSTCQDWVVGQEVTPGTLAEYAECVSLLRSFAPPSDGS